MNKFNINQNKRKVVVDIDTMMMLKDDVTIQQKLIDQKKLLDDLIKKYHNSTIALPDSMKQLNANLKVINDDYFLFCKTIVDYDEIDKHELAMDLLHLMYQVQMKILGKQIRFDNILVNNNNYDKDSYNNGKKKLKFLIENESDDESIIKQLEN